MLSQGSLRPPVHSSSRKGRGWGPPPSWPPPLCSAAAARRRDARAGRARLGRERAELDQLLLELEAGADEVVGGEPHVLAEARRGASGARRRQRPLEERVEIRRLAVRPCARARRAGSPRAASGRGARTRPAATRSRGRSGRRARAARPTVRGRAGTRCAGRPAPASRCRCRPARGSATPRRAGRLQRDLLPDRGLGGAALERRGGELHGLAPAQLGVGGVRARPEVRLRALQRPSSTHETGIFVSLARGRARSR